MLFITTANVLDPVPPALRDRMETLELPGYIDEEKLAIARQFLIPKNTRGHGLDPEAHLEITDEAVLTLVRNYTHEAGVRSLERCIAAICRKRAREVAAGGTGRLVVTPQRVRELLGVPPYRLETEIAERTRIPGVAVAVAWTPYGGDVLFVEASRMARDRGSSR
ncbi:MAG: hypothetical protein M5U28_47010 [Sandaracinaceae bacterium]|nr:hypothetical protein [Sandaracinaceae bacterium]